MALEDDDNTSLRNRLSELKYKHNVDERRELFCRYAHEWDGTNAYQRRFLTEALNDKRTFPSVKDTNYFLKFALKNYSYKMIELLEAIQLNIHEFMFDDGKSALHYLAELDGCKERNHYFDNLLGFNVTAPGETMRLIRFLVKKSQKNYSDKHGYSYLHGACIAGDGEKVRRFMSEGAGVDLDSYECSALHVAAQYRSRDIVKMLLDNGADPSQRDLEGSTPLHALAWSCLDEFATGYRFCDRKKPVDRIVDALLKRGADIEARNRHGDTPLQSASSCFDEDLVKCLLEHGASLDGLNEYRIFSRSFTTLELKNYPLTLNVIEVVQSLQSAGYRLSYWGRRRMLKCWVKIRGNDTDHLIPCVPEGKFLDSSHDFIINELMTYERFGYFMKQEAVNYLHEQLDRMKPKLYRDYIKYEPSPRLINQWELEVATLNSIMLNDDISLHELCQMGYREGYLIMKKMNNWRVPSLRNLPYLSIIVKRHLANIMIRPHLELLVADLFMTDPCRLNMPYTFCRKVAEYMSDEDLFRLRELVDDNRVGFFDTLYKFKKLIHNLTPQLRSIN